MYQHINSTTAPKGNSETVHVHPVNPYRGYPSYDGEDVICCNCGHILGWLSQEEMPKCPASGCELEEIMQLNIDKLKARYPDGFSAERSEHRAEEDI